MHQGVSSVTIQPHAEEVLGCTVVSDLESPSTNVRQHPAITLTIPAEADDGVDVTVSRMFPICPDQAWEWNISHAIGSRQVQSLHSSPVVWRFLVIRNVRDQVDRGIVGDLFGLELVVAVLSHHDTLRAYLALLCLPL